MNLTKADKAVYKEIKCPVSNNIKLPYDEIKWLDSWGASWSVTWIVTESAISQFTYDN